MTTGECIRAARKKAGLTQKQLGELCGIAEPTIRRYELGKLNPKRETLQKIAKPLGVRWYELYSDNIDELTSEIGRIIDVDTKKQSECEDEFISRLFDPVTRCLGRKIVDLNQEIRDYKLAQKGLSLPPMGEAAREEDAIFQVAHALLENGIYPQSYKTLLDVGFSRGEAFTFMAVRDSGIPQSCLSDQELDIEDNISMELDSHEALNCHEEQNKEA